jgi:hypothetical protein
MMKYKKITTIVVLIFFFFSGSSCTSPLFNTVTVIESFAAIWVNRPYLVKALNELYKEKRRDQFVIMKYYVDSTADHPFPRLSCDEAEERMKWYMPTDRGIPTTFFNGTEYMKGIPNPYEDNEEGKIKAFKEYINERISDINARIPPITITASCKRQETQDDFTISVSVKATDTLSYSSLMLQIALVENNIPYSAINGEDFHYFVFREWIKPPEIKDTIGIPLALKEVGDQYEAEFTYHLNSELYKQELSMIVFVQDRETKAILQGIEITPT